MKKPDNDDCWAFVFLNDSMTYIYFMRIQDGLLTFFFTLLVLPLIVFTQSVDSSLLSSILIQNVHVIDVKQGRVSRHQDVLIRDGVIHSIEKGLSIDSSQSEFIDGTGLYLMPGMIDAHIHLFQSGGLYTRPDAIDLRDIRPYSHERIWLQDNASKILKSYLRLGITSVIDMGGPMSNYYLRDQYGNSPEYPNLFVTGPLISTYQPSELNVDDPPIIKVKTTAEAREMVRVQLPYHPDFIKIWYINLPSLSADSTYDLVEAAIQESHIHGLRVAVHATELNTAKLAIRAGADILVHSVSNPIDEEFIEMLKINDVFYIPTLNVHENYDLVFANEKIISTDDLDIVSPLVIKSLLDVKHLRHLNLLEAQKYAQPMLKMIQEQNLIRSANLKRLAQFDINITSGTDAGNIGTLHAGSYFKELKSMKSAGMSNKQIVRASTITAARSIQKEDLIGSVQVGKQADLIVLNDNPFENLETLRKIQMVIKGGQLLRSQSDDENEPEDLVQQQLNAYNLGNLEAFLKPYSDNVVVFQFHNQVLLQGKGQMKAKYKGLFNKSPQLYAELTDRMVLGNTVIDRELITFNQHKVQQEIIVTYKIENGKIKEVYIDDGR